MTKLKSKSKIKIQSINKIKLQLTKLTTYAVKLPHKNTWLPPWDHTKCVCTIFLCPKNRVWKKNIEIREIGEMGMIKNQIFKWILPAKIKELEKWNLGVKFGKRILGKLAQLGNRISSISQRWKKLNICLFVYV